MTQIGSLIILKPSVCKAKPSLKMMWCVPETQSVPSGLRIRRASWSHRTFHSWSFWKLPVERSQWPLSTDARRPLFTVTPPSERRYGGSAKTTSAQDAGIRRISPTQSERCTVAPGSP